MSKAKAAARLDPNSGAKQYRRSQPKLTLHSSSTSPPVFHYLRPILYALDAVATGLSTESTHQEYMRLDCSLEASRGLPSQA